MRKLQAFGLIPFAVVLLGAATGLSTVRAWDYAGRSTGGSPWSLFYITKGS